MLLTENPFLLTLDFLNSELSYLETDTQTDRQANCIKDIYIYIYILYIYIYIIYTVAKLNIQWLVSPVLLNEIAPYLVSMEI